MGHPIDHSKSPFIHAKFAAQTGESMVYGAIDVTPEEFAPRIDALFSSGYRGLNVTVPLKELAHDHARELTARAARARAVNTLRVEPDGRIVGDNTDGPGLVHDLEVNLSATIAGARVLLLGAGGAAAGVVGPLLDEQPAMLVVANRTAHKAVALATRFQSDGPVSGGGFEILSQGRFDLIVNATSASLSGSVVPMDASTFAPGARCYDLMYGNQETPFLSLAGRLGVRHRYDGRGMLVEQAAEAFEFWRGIRPRTGDVIRALGELLSSEGN